MTRCAMSNWGRGGIREIEFFAQTQQIILGGRNPSLRVRPTKQALSALVELGSVEPHIADELSCAYTFLRHVEHRIQMRLDEQTHSLPQQSEDRAVVAQLCGYSELGVFEADLLEVRRLVHHRYAELFSGNGASRTSKPQPGNLVFTGVDDDPGTLATLEKLGFESPSTVIAKVREWHRGKTPATRTERGREILTALLPDLLTIMSDTGEPDAAFTRFGQFLDGLRSGVQTLSMLSAERALLEDLIATLALAPRTAGLLARRPSLLESLLAISDHAETLPDLSDDDFETALNNARKWHGEQAFLVGHTLLHGQLSAADAGWEWTRLAEHIIVQMSAVAETETQRRFGPPPGKWAIMALGKLGGGEMTASSDLDLIVMYDAEPGADAQPWFTRFTQRLISALSAETGGGILYEVDMRLRPSGRSGPGGDVTWRV